MRLSGWSLGIRASIENSANILACPFCVPRINASKDTSGAILTYAVIFRVEKFPKPGVFQQPAREHNRIFSLCHYFAIMKRGSENESRHLGQNKMAGLKGKSGPPGNMNAFKHARKIFCINSSRLISPSQSRVSPVISL